MASVRRRTVLLTACWFATGALPAAAEDFVDSVGRTVHLPTHIARVLPAGPPADVLLFALAPGKLVGLVEPLGERAKAFAPRELADLPGIVRVTRKVDPADITALKALHGDLLVDYGDITPAYVEAADRISAATGVPYVVLAGYLADIPDTSRKLGRLLGAQTRGEEMATSAEAVLARLRPLNELPADKRVAVYYGRGADGLRSPRPGSILDESITFAGGRNVTPSGEGGFVVMTVADIKAAAPAVVVVADAKAAAPGSALRAGLPASTRFYVDPGRPFGWMEAPPSVNRLIGALWLAARLHPDLATFDAIDAKRLSEQLLNTPLSDAQVAEIMR